MSETITKCRYCGTPYTYSGDDPHYCGKVSCKKKMDADAFLNRTTSTGTNISAYDFTKVSRTSKKEEPTNGSETEPKAKRKYTKRNKAA